MTEFFSCDWGTTSFRLRRVNAVMGGVLAERREPSGVRTLLSSCPANDQAGREKAFALFLRAQLLSFTSHNPASLHGVAVIISGMASSSIGWRELPYVRVPVDLDGSSLGRDCFDLAIAEQVHVRVHLISGVCTETDIMRGEETEIVGIFWNGQHPGVADNGIVVLPGTHSKHVRLCARQITAFRTYMTGELFDVLSTHSLLGASVGLPESGPTGNLSESEPREAFIAGVRGASESGLAGSLFQTRVRTVLRKVPPAVNRWFLSGLLIGAETADLATRESDAPILLAAPEPLCAAYRLAFETLALQHRLTILPPEDMALAAVRGHCALLNQTSRSADGLHFPTHPGPGNSANRTPEGSLA
jgi:2-dehydro-3-deoxygalactonokinase